MSNYVCVHTREYSGVYTNIKPDEPVIHKMDDRAHRDNSGVRNFVWLETEAFIRRVGSKSFDQVRRE